MKEVKRVDYKSGARVLAIFVLIITLLNVILVRFIQPQTMSGLNIGDLAVAWLSSAVVSFILGMFFILVYNLLAKWIGGVKLEL
ncbi:hypothetical protein K8R33_03310 [archaeon]|nr:hypothetical protein [archaeon]